ncbi:glycerophosphodiester phosphodiesterase family protein [Lactonifactor longoviformis]|uniref:Glycerophosphoryl diester phosphodiesterase n=1 Tax=Lactonifactor longoviformis DSM 17459 TaxID=1122155 RepID=A0A1M4XM00_9CLOT|nr:glycerophosphodiester phosphodiesterase family protein [Lactonifactor longoviformis]SHE94212.1 Glycerophosphoryl diester phosphodiesterase [Lactonifactor longoviformis DSM 17459]
MKILTCLLILFLLYIFCILPRFTHRRESRSFRHILFAHRGLFSNEKGIPENSLPAFSRAVSKGYGIELDVQLTKDQQLVVFHDSTLSRMCGLDIHVREKTYEQLKELTLLHTKEQIPLFSQVLKLVDGQVPLLIEIKLPCFSTSTCALVDKAMAGYKGSYCIESFNSLALFWYRVHRPDVVRGQLSSNLTRPVAEGGYLLSFLVKHLLTNVLSRPDFISYCYKDTNNISFCILRSLLGTMTMVWTIRSQKAYERCLNRYDSLIFDNFIPHS